jgi:DNA polymerase (family 10)
MPIHNNDITDIFNQVADLLEIKGDTPFRVRAYRNAARAVAGLAQPVSDMIAAGKDVTTLTGIGRDLAAKIHDIVKTGRLPLLEDLQNELPEKLSTLLQISGLGSKRVGALYQTLNITSLDELERAAQAGRINDLRGFGKKIQQQILEDTKRLRGEKQQRKQWIVAEQYAEPLLAHLKRTKGVKEVVVAGSYRRRLETVRDLDILVTCKRGAPVMDRLVAYDDVEKVIAQGKTKSAVRLRGDLQVDLRVVPQVSYGSALLYFTGSKQHNIATRKLAAQKQLKLNEYGLFRGDTRIAGRTEQSIYQKMDLPWIDPELREDRGEIEAAQRDQLPRLISRETLRGDLHVHSRWTDGRHSIPELVEAARQRGYAYVAISDHSQRVTVAHGLKPRDLRRQIEKIDALNEQLDGFQILKAIEVDILVNGSLDLPNEVLKELDLTVCSIHSKFDLPQGKQTKRILKAMDNPYFNILGHPTGRMIHRREPYPVDMETLMQGAKERGCFLEVNAHPDRLDLNDIHCRLAREKGVKVALSTDTHRINDMDHMRFGIDQARRGWLEADDVINTRSLKDLRQILKR